jgi:galactokinase
VNNTPLQTNPPVRLLATFQEVYPSLTPNHIVKAADREMWVAAATSSSAQFTVHVAELNARATFSYQSAKGKRTVTNRPLPGWARYVAGVILLSDETSQEFAGLAAVIAGNEPPGPRYEYALGIAFATLWYELQALPCTITHLIELMDRIRREYVE